MQDFRNLVVWQKSHQLALSVYRVTTGFPREEQFGLISQMRRAAVSIPSNIAEGCGRGGDTEFARFLQMALGSSCELEYQFLLSHDLGWLEKMDFERLQPDLVEVRQMLSGLLARLRLPKSNSVRPKRADPHS